MKIYKYWQIEKATVDVDGEAKQITCYGGSNFSDEDARLHAREKIDKVRRKIAGEAHLFEDYQVEIREEIIQMIDEQSIVTRNRYGAQVLNVQDLMILDIDQPKASLGDVFRKRDAPADKQKIAEMIRKLSQKSAYGDCGFRLYETQKGMRVIVVGKTFDPKAPATQAMMKEFNCDALYRLLCKKQDCFRARLTPKPSRMNVRGHKVRYPRGDQEERDFRTWLTGYEAASSNFSTCKFVEQIGTGYLPEAVRLHDEISGAYHNQKLA